MEPYDLLWKSLMYAESPHLIKFVIHASINWVTTSDLLLLWNKTGNQSCVLCKAEICSIGHILSSCKYSLTDRRYSWRHDSVLSTLEPSLRQRLHIVNSKPFQETIPKLSTSFVKPGAATKLKAPPTFDPGCLAGARDWQMLIDYDHRHYVFPISIYSTPQRPDIVIWSLSIKKVFLFELTVPLEENFGDTYAEKSWRYRDLCTQINDNEGPWKAVHFPFEVGACGFVARSTRGMLRNWVS